MKNLISIFAAIFAFVNVNAQQLQTLEGTDWNEIPEKELPKITTEDDYINYSSYFLDFYETKVLLGDGLNFFGLYKEISTTPYYYNSQSQSGYWKYKDGSGKYEFKISKYGIFYKMVVKGFYDDGRDGIFLYFKEDATSKTSTSISTASTPSPSNQQPVAAQSGKCGANLTWELTVTSKFHYTLTISGSGEMNNYTYPPWDYYAKRIGYVVIDNGVTTIGNNAFRDCALASVIIPKSITTIGENAFWFCSYITSVTIPGSVTTIGKDAFIGCERLTQINVDAANTAFSSYNGVLFNKQQTVLIRYPEGKLGTDYTVPNDVVTIGEDAFALLSRLTSVTLPNSVKNIEKSAFYHCFYLTSIKIPKSVTTIGRGAFSDCNKLKSVKISNAANVEFGAFNTNTKIIRY